jgi:hypothetical protein
MKITGFCHADRRLLSGQHQVGSTHSAKASALAFNVTARSASQILDIRVAETLDHTARAAHPRLA